METKRIKIFVDAHSFDTEFQGTQTFIEGLYTALMVHYPQLDIYFGAYDTERVKKVFPLLDSSKILRYKKQKPSAFRFLIDIPQFIKKYAFDFAHFQYIIPFSNKHCKYIVTTHDVLFNDFPKEFSQLYRYKRNFLFKKSLQKAAIKTTVSAYSREKISSNYKMPEKHIHIIPNGMKVLPGNDLNKENARQFIKEIYGIENFILNVSRIEPRKNHLLLLNKFLELELYKQNISLVFIGKQSIKVPELTEIISNLTAEQKRFFYWIEQVDTEALLSFYQSCQLFVYPSKAEGFGIPPLEAALNLAPVLCSETTAMSDFNFFSPNTFNPENENDFSAKLKNMIGHPPALCSLIKISEDISEKYSWHKSASLFYNLIKSWIQ